MSNNIPLKYPDALNFFPGIAWFLFVLILICMPGKSVPEPGWFEFAGLDKLIHAVLFGGIVFLFCRPFRNAPVERAKKIALFIKIALATCIWGITTELIQKFFVAGRQFDLLDWAADTIGAFLAFFASKWLFARTANA